MKKTSSLLITLFIYSIVVAQSGAPDPTFGINATLHLHPNFTAEQLQDIALTNDGKILLLTSSKVNGDHFLCLNPDGSLDTTFSGDGIRSILGNNYSALSMEVDTQNQIILSAVDVNYYYSTVILRFFEDGTYDDSFSDSGYIHPDIYSNRALFLQKDQKILLGGTYAGNKACVGRININGSIDSSFNDDGLIVFYDLGYGYAYAISEQTDGKLLVTGGADSNLFVIRLNSNGHLDQSFGTNGYTVIDNGKMEAGQGIAELPDGKILVVGHSEDNDSSSMLCWRFLSDGSLDNSFGDNGTLNLNSGIENNFSWFVFANEDSTSIIGGTIFTGTSYQPTLYHLLSDGTLDENFGVNGIAKTNFPCGRSIQLSEAMSTNGKIFVGATGFDNGNNYASVAAFSSNGNIDDSFGINGAVHYATSDSSYSEDQNYDFAELPDGKILCAGRVIGIDEHFAIFRVNSNGSLDASYGTNGYYVPDEEFNLHEGFMAADSNHVYIEESGAPLNYGVEDLTGDFYSSEILIRRFLTDGTPDTSFATSGILRLAKGSGIQCKDLKLQSDGKLLVAFAYFSDSATSYLMRLNEDGSIDQSFSENGTKTFDWTYQYNNNFRIAIQPDGNIICSSISHDSNFTQYYLKVVRLQSDGTQINAYNLSTDYLEVIDVLIQQDNEMLFYLTNGISSSLFRLNEDGTIDNNFSSDGYYDPPTLGPLQIGMLIQPDNKILLAGKTTNNLDLAVSRVLNNSSTDATFGTNGTTTITGVDPVFSNSVKLQDDDKILVFATDLGEFFLARLLNEIVILVNDIETSNAFEAYPNPASDQLIINYPFPLNEEATIIITDVTGKILNEEKVNASSDHYVMNVSDLSSGIYFLTLKTKTELNSVKVMKE